MRQPKFRRNAIAIAIASAFVAQVGTASSPVTGEFRVNNTFLSGHQRDVKVAHAADGRFVVVWNDQGGSDGSGQGIKARVYGADGVALGSEFVVNQKTTSTQHSPDVAMDADGDFVVTWAGYPDVYPTYGTGYGIFARRFNASGTAVTGDIAVNTFTTGAQRSPTVAMDADGDFVVAWESYNQTGDLGSYGIFFHRFLADGTPQGGDTLVNVTTTGPQLDPDVAMDASGNFVVVWESGDGSNYGIWARRYTSAGVNIGSEVKINVSTTGNQSNPAIARDADGDYVVAWDENQALDGAGYSIQARRYSGAGAAQGAAFTVNETTRSSQRMPAVAIDADGDFVIAWQSHGEYPYYAEQYSVAARRYSAAGVAQTSEFQVNVFDTSAQTRAGIAMDADGDFVVAWESYNQLYLGVATHYDIFARRYNGPENVDMSISANGPAQVAPDRTITYTMSATNNHAVATTTGNATIDAAIGQATGVQILDTLPANTDFLSASGTGWTCDNSGGNVTCEHPPLAAASTTPLLTVRARSPEAEANDTLTNNATVDAEQADGTPANNSQDTVTNVVCSRGTISFTVNGFRVDEFGTSAAVTVSRDSGTCGAASVSFTTANGTAVAGSDYTDADMTLNWAAGEGGVRTVSVPIASDSLDEPAETVALALSGVTGATLGTHVAVDLTIIDDDIPVVQFSSTGQTVSEGVGNVVLTATTTHLSTVPLVLNVARSGTAKSVSDFTGTFAQITIPAGSSSATRTLVMVNDTEYEPTAETIVFTSTGVTTGAMIGANNINTTTITDNDPLPAVTFTAATSNHNEGTTRTLVVQLNRKSQESTSVAFSLNGAGTTATENVDFVNTGTSPIVIPAGQTQKTFKLVAVDDTVTEGAETIRLDLTVPANAQAGTNLSHIMTINASD